SPRPERHKTPIPEAISTRPEIGRRQSPLPTAVDSDCPLPLSQPALHAAVLVPALLAVVAARRQELAEAARVYHAGGYFDPDLLEDGIPHVLGARQRECGIAGEVADGVAESGQDQGLRPPGLDQELHEAREPADVEHGLAVELRGPEREAERGGHAR